MVHISKRQTDNKKLMKIFNLFYEIVRSTHDKEHFIELIKDIISPLEQIMIAKRIAIIYLLIKNISTIDIADYLKVSTSTVAKFTLLFNEKETILIQQIKCLLKKEKITHFVEDAFVEIFTQPGVMIGHRKRYWEHKKRQKERKMLDG